MFESIKIKFVHRRKKNQTWNCGYTNLLGC